MRGTAHRFIRISVILFAALPLSTAAQQQSASSTTYRIAGVLQDSVSGQPISGATITITPSRTAPSLQQTRTVTSGTDGRFSFERVPAGKYQLHADMRGYPPQFYQQHGTFFTGVVTGPELNTENLVFRMFPQAVIAGSIKDEFGEPVRDATVMLFRSVLQLGSRRTLHMMTVSSNDLGQYRFTHLAPGRYFIAVSARPWYAHNNRVMQRRNIADGFSETSNSALDVTFPITYYGDVTDQNEAVPLELKPGAHADADINLRSVGSVHVRVVNPEGPSGSPKTPSPGFSLRQRVFGLPQHVPMQMGWDGAAAEISGIAPGHYILNASTPNRNYTREVDLYSDTDVNLLESVPKATVRGIVQVIGAPSRVAVAFRDTQNGGAFGVAVPENGNFEQSLNPGVYEVDGGGPGGVLILSVAASGAELAGRTLTINGGGTVSLAVIMGNGVGEIDGVAKRDRKPISGAMILLCPDDAAHNRELFRMDQSDGDGSFTLRGVVPGRYTVMAIEDAWDWEWSSPDILKRFAVEGTAVNVQGKGTYKIDVEAKRASALRAAQ